MNDRNLRRVANKIFEDLQHFPRCERAQREIVMVAMGSELPNANAAMPMRRAEREQS